MASKSIPKVPYIALEEHWFSPAVVSSFSEEDITKLGFPRHLYDSLQDVDSSRIKDMNEHNVALQVISHAPIIYANATPTTQLMPTEQCRKSNDELYEKTSNDKVKKRFRGFARLPMHDPQAATAELKRCVKDLGFVGALVDNTLYTPSTKTQSVYYDHPAYDELWNAFCELNVPLYLHPCYVPEGPTTSQYRFEPNPEGFSHNSSIGLSAFAFGWHIDTALHFLRLFASGVWDRHPKLKLVLGHFGESIPFFLERTGHVLGRTEPSLKRDLATVYKENVWITSSGFWGKAPIAATLAVTSHERVMFSVDWPFSNNEQGTQFMEWLWNSGHVTEEQWRDIAYRNALKLFGWSQDEVTGWENKS